MSESLSSPSFLGTVGTVAYGTARALQPYAMASKDTLIRTGQVAARVFPALTLALAGTLILAGCAYGAYRGFRWIQDLQAEAAGLREQLRTAPAAPDRSELQGHLTEANDRCTQLTQEVRELQENLIDIQAQKTQTEKELEALRAGLELLQEDAQGQQKEAEKRVGQLRGALAAQDRMAAVSLLDREQKQAEILRLQTELQAAKEAHQADSSNLEKEIQALRAQVEALQQQVAPAAQAEAVPEVVAPPAAFESPWNPEAIQEARTAAEERTWAQLQIAMKTFVESQDYQDRLKSGFENWVRKVASDAKNQVGFVTNLIGDIRFGNARLEEDSQVQLDGHNTHQTAYLYLCSLERFRMKLEAEGASEETLQKLADLIGEYQTFCLSAMSVTLSRLSSKVTVPVVAKRLEKEIRSVMNGEKNSSMWKVGFAGHSVALRIEREDGEHIRLRVFNLGAGNNHLLRNVPKLDNGFIPAELCLGDKALVLSSEEEEIREVQEDDWFDLEARKDVKILEQVTTRVNLRRNKRVVCSREFLEAHLEKFCLDITQAASTGKCRDFTSVLASMLTPEARVDGKADFVASIIHSPPSGSETATSDLRKPCS